MSANFIKTCAALAVGAAFSLPAAAEMSAADIAKLGTTLTPIGAEKAGNAAGTIPAWDGGITKPLPNPAQGRRPPSLYPYASDKLAFMDVDAKNVDKYKDNLSVGQDRR